MSTFDDILKRRSIRKFTSDKVEKETVMKLLQAAMAAPSACNNQPWEFIVVEERINELRKVLYFGNYNAPLGIIVCGNLKIAKGGLERYWVQDCSAAIENILNAATGFDLGSVWIGLYPLDSAIDPVNKLLDMPDYVVPLGVVLVGYPDEVKEPRSQFDEKRVYFEKYDKSRKHRTKDKNSKFK